MVCCSCWNSTDVLRLLKTEEFFVGLVVWSGGWLSLAECLAVINHRLLSSMEWYSLNYWRIYLVSAVKFILWVTYNFLHRRSTHDANEIIFTVDKSHIISYTWQYISNIKNIVKSLLKWKLQKFACCTVAVIFRLLPQLVTSNDILQQLQPISWNKDHWLNVSNDRDTDLVDGPEFPNFVWRSYNCCAGDNNYRAVISQLCSINRIQSI